MNRTTRARAVLGGVCALLLGAGGCTDAHTAWLYNDSDIVMRVRFWCGPRESGNDPTSLTPGDVYDVDPGKRVTVQLDEEDGFVSSEASIVRIQAQPLNVSFKRIVHYWFERDVAVPCGVKALGVRLDIRAERDGPGTITSVPIEYSPTHPYRH